MPIYNQPHGGPPGLFKSGPTVEVEFHLPQVLVNSLSKAGQVIPPPISGLGLIDTGASHTGIDDSIAQALALPVIGTFTMGSAQGPCQANYYPVRMKFPGTSIDITMPRTGGVQLTGQTATLPGKQPQPLIALIGRDILAGGVLIYNGITGIITLAL